MEYSRLKRFNTIFFKTFLILILSSIIPVIGANWIIYRQSAILIQKQLWNTSLSMLNKSSAMVNLIYREIEQIHNQVANDKNVIQLALNPHLEEFPRNQRILNMIGNIASSNEYIDSIYIYSTHAGTVFHSNGNIYKVNSFFDRIWMPEYLKSNSAVLWLETRPTLDNAGDQTNSITSISNIPYGSESKMGAVVINIHEQMIHKAFEGHDANAQSEVYAISPTGIILSHKNKARLYENIKYSSFGLKIVDGDSGTFAANYMGDRNLFTFITSPFTDWKYIYRIPVNQLKDDTVLVFTIILVITMIYIILSLLVSYLISKGIYIPIKHLVDIALESKKLSERTLAWAHITNEYTFLESVYSDVIDKNKTMEERLNNLKPLIKEKLFTNLIMGVNENLKEVSERISFLGYKFSLMNYLVIAIQIDDYNRWFDKYNDIDRNFQKLDLTSMIEQVISSYAQGASIEVEPDKIVAIINYPNTMNTIQVQQDSIKLASEIKNKIESLFPFTVTLGIGRFYRNITDLHNSYIEARNALKYKLYQGKNKIIDISNIDVQDEELYFYHSEKERIIINKLKTGHHEEITLELKNLFDEIHGNRSIPYNYLQNMFVRITSSMVEVIIDSGLSVSAIFGKQYNLFDELAKRETLDDIGIWFKEIARKISHAVNEVNLKRIDRNVEKIITYIENHLQDDITLNALADLVGFSSPYVSRIFKENIGINYAEYLSKKRIEKAKQLLKDTIFTIKEIGFRVGFNSIQTFLRTFKKCEGITPGQYRENLRISSF